MDTNKKTLLLFTGAFPYGKRGEPFLENEIIYLANCFETIYIFPRQRSKESRLLPSNVKIIDILIIPPFKILKQPLKNILSALISIFKEALQAKKGINYILNIRHFIYIWIEARKLSINLENWLINNQIINPLFYTYWSDTSLLACSLLSKEDANIKIISRAHGFDLYNDRNIGSIVPFRNYKYKRVINIYCISQHGQNYLKLNLPNTLHNKLKLSYLGITPPSRVVNKPITDISVIVSVAIMQKFKRISLIPEVLRSINTPIHWVHFGDGEEYELLKEKVKNMPTHIKITLMGQKKNSEILEFYYKNQVSLFLSLSTSEGLPVSMIEAISFGIPIMAININGVPEIVTKHTGVLLDLDENIKNIASKLEFVINNDPFDKKEIKNFYSTHFNAELNYATFANEIATLI